MVLTIGSFISKLTKVEAPRGPSPAYTPTHVIRLLLVLDSEQAMGRIALSKRLGLGEGSVRTIIKKLVESSVISVDAVGGCHLTDLGKSLVTDLRKVILNSKKIDLGEMGITAPAMAVQLRGVPLSGSSYTRLRDVAVRNGSEGMIIFMFKCGSITLPMMTEEVAKEYPKITSALESSFQLNEGDVMFTAFSKDINSAEQGALSAAITLIS